MSTNKFLLGFLVVALLFYAKSQIIRYWVPIEFSYFLMFFIIRASNTTRALTLVFLLSLGLDFLFQIGQVKGLSALGQLPLVYLIMVLKKRVVPLYEDLFLLGFFAFFFIANYYISLAFSQIFNVHFSTITATNLFFMALFHTAILGLLLTLQMRFSRVRK